MSAGAVLLVLLGAAAVDIVLAAGFVGRRFPGLARTRTGAVRGPLAGALAGLVVLYRATWSSRNAGMCRFEPSCSAYALTAVRRHGGVRGGVLAVVRVLRCQPLCAGGYQPVPGQPWPGEPSDSRSSDSRSSEGTDGEPAVVREFGAMTNAAAPTRGRDVPRPALGERAETVGSGRGPCA